MSTGEVYPEEGRGAVEEEGGPSLHVVGGGGQRGAHGAQEREGGEERDGGGGGRGIGGDGRDGWMAAGGWVGMDQHPPPPSLKRDGQWSGGNITFPQSSSMSPSLGVGVGGWGLEAGGHGGVVPLRASDVYPPPIEPRGFEFWLPTF